MLRKRPAIDKRVALVTPEIHRELQPHAIIHTLNTHARIELANTELVLLECVS